MSYHGIWSNAEHAELERLLLTGMTYRQIAERMGRSYNSITGRIFIRNMVARPVKQPPKIAYIDKASVPEWYELGWRFIGFSDGLCQMEWRSEKPERRPALERMAA